MGFLNNALRTVEDSSTVVLARDSTGGPVAGIESSNKRPLAWIAFGIAILCAALVFSFLALRERSFSLHLAEAGKIGPVVPRNAAPAAPGHLADAASRTFTDRTNVVARPEPPALQLLERRDRKVTQFILAESTDFQRLGPVQLKVTGVDAVHGSYNLLLMAKGRRFDKSNIKLNEAVNISPTGARTAPQIVVNGIVPGGVQGYLSEPGHSGSSHRRWHRRHRWTRSKS
jgi:hypothetical protein